MRVKKTILLRGGYFRCAVCGSDYAMDSTIRARLIGERHEYQQPLEAPASIKDDEEV